MPPTPSAPRRVLIVDDDPDLSDVLRRVLHRRGYIVQVARNGREALAALRQAQGPDVVLLDLMMPEMNGWEFRAEQLKDPELSGIPVVVFSGHGKIQQDGAAIKAAANLRKPVALEDLLQVLGRVLSGEDR
jgi:CheY-like chemotaxis protein